MDRVALLTIVSMSSPDISTLAIPRKVAQSALLKLNLGVRGRAGCCVRDTDGYMVTSVGVVDDFPREAED